MPGGGKPNFRKARIGQSYLLALAKVVVGLLYFSFFLFPFSFFLFLFVFVFGFGFGWDSFMEKLWLTDQ